jgi:GTPase SAR1 family protein
MIHHQVYDVTNRESFNALSWWFSEKSKFAPEPIVKMIVGNKSDKVTDSSSYKLLKS